MREQDVTKTPPKLRGRAGKSNNRKWQKSFIANILLLILGAMMSISGLIIQCHYHLMGSCGEYVVLTLNRTEWNVVHVWSSIGFLLIAGYHVWLHRKWYENALKRNLLSKHRPTVILTLLAIIVVASGLMPLLICYFGGNSILRFSIIEIHDKAAILFFILLFLHTAKRVKWYSNIIKNKF